MIKVLKVYYKCYCGNEFESKREIIVDEYLTNIKIQPYKKCLCGSKGKAVITNIILENSVPGAFNQPTTQPEASKRGDYETIDIGRIRQREASL